MGYFSDRYGDEDDDPYSKENDPTGYHAHWDAYENKLIKFVDGTRLKCSCCGKYKDKSDFNKEQAAKPASRRICTDCGAPLPSSLEVLTISQIKIELERRNAEVPLTGKKAVYVEALRRAVEEASTTQVNSANKENQEVAAAAAQSQPLPEYLNKLTVVRLKQELKARGLKVSGLKAELVERLSQATGIPATKPAPLAQQARQARQIAPAANEPSDCRVPQLVLVRHKSLVASAPLSNPTPTRPPLLSKPPPSLLMSSFFRSKRATLQLVKKRLAVLDKKQLMVQLAHGIKIPLQQDGTRSIWHGDTPLIDVIRARNAPVVRYLLELEADPTLETVTQREEGSLAFETAADIANEMRSVAAKKAGNENETIQSLDELDEIVALLAAAAPFWSPCNYSGAQYSKARKTPTNKPSYPAVLRKALSMVPSSSLPTIVDDSKTSAQVKDTTDGKKMPPPVVQAKCLECQGRKGCDKIVSAKCSFGCCGKCCKDGIGKAAGGKKCAFKNHRKK